MTRQATKAKRIMRKNYDPYDMRSSIIDMLTDLRHLCDAEQADFGDIDRIAYNHYSAERHERLQNEKNKEN